MKLVININTGSVSNYQECVVVDLESLNKDDHELISAGWEEEIIEVAKRVGSPLQIKSTIEPTELFDEIGDDDWRGDLVAYLYEMESDLEVELDLHGPNTAMAKSLSERIIEIKNQYDFDDSEYFNTTEVDK